MLALAAMRGPQIVIWSQKGCGIGQESRRGGERDVEALGRCLGRGVGAVSVGWAPLSSTCSKVASLRFRRSAIPEEAAAVGAAVDEQVSDEVSVEDSPAAVSGVVEYSGPTVKVKFELQQQCHFGQQFNVVGDDAQFGNWEPTAAIPMDWSAGHVWSTEVDVPEGKRIEFKYVLTGNHGETDWQPGVNQILVAGSQSMLVTEPWNDGLPETSIDGLLQPDEPALHDGESGVEGSEVSTPGDALADAAASAAMGMLNTGVKAAAALEGGIGAALPAGDSDREMNGVAREKEDTPTAVEVPVISTAVAAAAEEVQDRFGLNIAQAVPPKDAGQRVDLTSSRPGKKNGNGALSTQDGSTVKGEKKKQQPPLNALQKDLEWLSNLFFGGQ